MLYDEMVRTVGLLRASWAGLSKILLPVHELVPTQLALAERAWMGGSERAHSAHAPIRESGVFPHVERDPLLFPGPIISTRLCALAGIWQSTRRRVLGG
jgi:hypothetical protein